MITYEQLAPASLSLMMGTKLCKSCGRTGQFGVTVTRRPIGLQDSSAFEQEAPRIQERIVICSLNYPKLMRSFCGRTEKYCIRFERAVMRRAVSQSAHLPDSACSG